MITINPYLNFPGTSEQAFRFYQSVFGGELSINRFKDTPEAARLNAEDQEKMMHIALIQGKSVFLMATDTLEAMGHKHIPGNNYHLSIQASTEQEAREIFSKLSQGGTVTIPIEKQFWGDVFGMITDRFGIQWMVNYSESHQSSTAKK